MQNTATRLPIPEMIVDIDRLTFYIVVAALTIVDVVVVVVVDMGGGQYAMVEVDMSMRL